MSAIFFLSWFFFPVVLLDWLIVYHKRCDEYDYEQQQRWTRILNRIDEIQAKAENVNDALHTGVDDIFRGL